MKPYKQLASEQRYQIYGLKQAGLDQSQIALYLGVNKSTISRELSRNKGQRGWRPKLSWFNGNRTFELFMINHYERRKVHAKETSQLQP
ncbi:helix-turn-helix domain-containing protein [uncultured Desulfobulbus sp.]|uniref:helix-turn-helix domain-containing protein n=1 Tax=uncultured Desulfobulbus sp. TaxID=239745 RepID=UPI0029C72E3F|nr:helix-turn-helix domain-containing protein [uncultured Desulfobulbus sp.]